MPEYQFNEMTFHWTEASWGNNRGISVYVKGVEKSDIDYKAAPNPHNNRAYNKNQQGFYLAAIAAAAPKYNTEQNAWPDSIEFDWENETYTLTPR